MTVVQFAEWRPDVAELNSAYATDISNVLCADGSYIPFPKLVSFTAALAATPLGAFRASTLTGQTTIFVGSATKLWKLDNTTLTWTDISKPATTYHANSDARWSFAQFGTFVIAVNPNDDPQVFELGVSTNFRDLGGSPPRASYVKVWGDFVALMGLISNLDRVQWSGLNDCEFWTPGSNNSDYQTFPDGGVVQGSNEATNPLVFQQHAIRKATFVPGSLEIFTFNKIHDFRGAKAALSIASRGAYVFYADEGGFFQIGTDGSITPIGFEKVDKTAFGQISAVNATRIIGAVDPFYSRVYWAADYAGVGNYNTLLIYDWNLQRWSQSLVSIQMHMPAATPGYTLEGLDAVSASLDALPFSLDSKVWQGGAPLLAAFDLSNKLGFFNGSNAEASLQTQEQGDVSGGVTLITSIYPIVDTSNVRVSIGSRLRRQDDPTWTLEGQPSGATGRVLKKSRGRFHRARVRIPADTPWGHAQGIDVELQPSGTR